MATETKRTQPFCNILNNPRKDLLQECDFDHTVLNSRTPVIIITIKNYQYPALVDSGSEVCAFSELVGNNLLEDNSIPMFPVSGVRVSRAFKNKHGKITHQALLRFKLSEKFFEFEFLCIPELIYPVIIGCDWLRSVSANINLRKKCILINSDGNSLEIPEAQFNHNYAAPHYVAMRTKSINGAPHIFDINLIRKDSRFDKVIQNLVLPEDDKIRLKTLLEKYTTLFSDKPGLISGYSHEISLSDDSPFYQKPYPIPIAHRLAVQAEIDLMVQWGVIERTNSAPYCSPLVTIVKKDGSIRVCLDAR